jgi:hypothetical protein
MTPMIRPEIIEGKKTMVRMTALKRDCGASIRARLSDATSWSGTADDHEEHRSQQRIDELLVAEKLQVIVGAHESRDRFRHLRHDHEAAPEQAHPQALQQGIERESKQEGDRRQQQEVGPARPAGETEESRCR